MVVKIVPKYTVMTFFGDQACTALSLGKCKLQLQSWQPTITFHNFLRGEREDNFW